MFALITNIILSTQTTRRQKTLLVSLLEVKVQMKKRRMSVVQKDEKQPPVSGDFVALCIFTQGITWSQTKEEAPRDVFLPAWDFDTCLAAANWNGSVSNEISARRMGREKKVTHYNNSTWFTELSHLCLPTFPLISFRDLGKVCVCVCTCPPDIYRLSFPHGFFCFIYICTKIKTPHFFSGTCSLSLTRNLLAHESAFIYPWLWIRDYCYHWDACCTEDLGQFAAFPFLMTKEMTRHRLNWRAHTHMMIQVSHTTPQLVL